MLVLPEQHQPRLDTIPDDCPDVVIVPDREMLWQYKCKDESAVMTPRRISGQFNELALSLLFRLNRRSKFHIYDMASISQILDNAKFRYRAELELIYADMKEIKTRLGLEPKLRLIKEYSGASVYRFHTDGADPSGRDRLERVMCCYNGPTTEGLMKRDAVAYGGFYKCRDGAQPFHFGIGDIWIQACVDSYSKINAYGPDPFIHRAVAIRASDPPRILVVT